MPALNGPGGGAQVTIGTRGDRRHAWRDWQFAAACAAGPVAWWAMARGGIPIGDPTWAWREPWHFVWLSLLLPVWEEWVFRGWMQPLVAQGIARARWPSPRLLANLATSLAFAAMHLPSHPVAWAAAVVVPSVVFGHFRDRHGHVGSAMALHAFYNAGYFLLFGRFGSGH